MTKNTVIAFGMLLFFIAGTGLAKADTIYDLNEDGCSATCSLPGSGSYGTVDLTQSGSKVNVNVQLYVGSNPSSPDIEFIQNGSHYSFAANLSPAITLSQITNVSSNVGSFNDGVGSVSQSRFGTFDFYFKCSSCGSGGSNYPNDPDQLSFTIDNVTISEFVPNSNGTTFTADIYDHLNKQTGPVGDSGPLIPSVPEPSSFLLLGTGLAALAGVLKRPYSLPPE